MGILPPFVIAVSSEKNQVNVEGNPGGTQLCVSVEAEFYELNMFFSAKES